MSAGSPHEALRTLAADERDVELLTALFHPQAEIVGVRGPQNISDWLETMRGPRSFPTSMHFLGDPLIEIAEDGTAATLDSYAVVYQLSAPDSGNADLTLGMRYLDETILFEGRWVIRRRTTRTLWMR
jgi:SnoaL-like domain